MNGTVPLLTIKAHTSLQCDSFLTFTSLAVSLRTTKFNIQQIYVLPTQYKSLTEWFLKPWWKVFTARYGLIP
jgi:hypothetical protein